jgi:hypothetical protein
MRTTIRIAILGLLAVLLAVPMLRAQDLSKYRRFSLGTNLATVLELTNQTTEDVNVTHVAPALFQELTWWPPSLPKDSLTSNNVQRIVFSFYNGELYKISVIYEQSSIEGLTAGDIVRSISAQYGPPVVAIPPAAALPSRDGSRQKFVATWEDSRYSLNLVQSPFNDEFGLVIYSKPVEAEARVAIVEALKVEEQQAPQKEAERQKKRMADLEEVRQKNRKNFRP